MSFPNSPRVRYNKNPLIEVICQLRFPKILTIEKDPPADIQESIRPEYPSLVVKEGIEFAFPMPKEAQPFALSRGKSYEFGSEDNNWKLVLSSDFIALSTNAYYRWEAFYEKLQNVVSIVSSKYGITYFSRIGLRYQDVIIRSQLNLVGVPWRNLIRPEFVGLLASDELSEDEFVESLNIARFSLSDEKSTCRVRSGLAKREQDSEMGYLIDSDFFSEIRTEVGNVRDSLEFYNREAGRFFRWCIQPTLHEAMEPQSLE